MRSSTQEFGMSVQTASEAQIPGEIGHERFDAPRSEWAKLAPDPLWRRFLTSAELWAPITFLLFAIVVCFFVPLIFTIPSPISGNILNVNLPMFARGHLLGTDPQGYDEVARLLYGGRVSLEVGFGSVTIGIIAGTMLGGIAGLKRGVIETLIMRMLDVLLAFPALILAVTISAYFGASEVNVIWAIGFVFTAAFGRLARAQTLRVREQTFITASRLSGTSDRRIFFGHIVPNIFPSLVTLGVILVGVAVALEAALSYLGAGVPPPGPSWGNMINLGQGYLVLDPRLVIVPSAALFLTITALNLLSDAIRVRWASR
jgi:peptide/nickel transport system permease protein